MVFNHGKESGPWGRKISHLAEVARSLGWSVESPDYQGEDDPAARSHRLGEVLDALDGPWVLVGSSMGAWVAMDQARRRASDPRLVGLMLLAPAAYLPGYPGPFDLAADLPSLVVHGWHDEVIPVEIGIRLAREAGADLLVVDGDHGLHDALPRLVPAFRGLLERAAGSAESQG